MEIKLKYEEARAQHPDLVDVLVGKINASNSKDKNKPGKDYDWSYTYGVVVKGMSFGEMMSQVGRKNIEPEEQKTNNEIINNKLSSVMGLSLTISAGRTKRYVALSDQPKLFIDKFSAIYAKDIEEQQKETDRISKLTPEEKNRETQEHINELSGMGGFIGLNVGPNGVTQIMPTEIEYDTDEILDKIGRVGYEGLTAGEKKFLEQK